MFASDTFWRDVWLFSTVVSIVVCTIFHIVILFFKLYPINIFILPVLFLTASILSSFFPVYCYLDGDTDGLFFIIISAVCGVATSLVSGFSYMISRKSLLPFFCSVDVVSWAMAMTLSSLSSSEAWGFSWKAFQYLHLFTTLVLFIVSSIYIKREKNITIKNQIAFYKNIIFAVMAVGYFVDRAFDGVLFLFVYILIFILLIIFGRKIEKNRRNDNVVQHFQENDEVTEISFHEEP